MNASRGQSALLAAMALLAAGCGGTPERTITAEEAVRRIDGYVQETIRSVPTSLRFSARKVDTGYGGGCVKGLSDSGFTGQIKPSLFYTATVPPTGNGEVTRFLNAAASYWKGKTPSVDTSTPGWLGVRPYQDDYRLLISHSPAVHTVELGGTLDTCIWRSGTPQPTDDP